MRHFVSRCLSCHQADPGGHVAAMSTPAASGKDDCISCHMPRRGTREGAHLVSTDHWISTGSGREGSDSRPYIARFAPDGDPELVPIWPEADPSRRRTRRGLYPPQ